MAKRWAPRRARLFKLLAVLLGLVLASAMGEIGLRLSRARFRALRESEGATDCDRTSRHRELVYEGVPNACGQSSWGFCDVEHAVEPSPGTLRIAVVGDSVAAADGVWLDDGLGRVLERRLAADLQRPVEVVTMAHSGYATSQEIFLIEHEVVPLDPRLVVVLYVLNDPDHPVYGTSSGQVANYYDRPPSYLVDWLEGAVYAIRENQHESTCPQPWANFIHCAHEGEVRESFRRIGEISRHASVPFLVAIHPFLTDSFERTEYPYADLHGKLAALARQNGMEAVDLREAYRGHEVSEVQQDPEDPLHPNAFGHDLVGSYLAHTIAARADLR